MDSLALSEEQLREIAAPYGGVEALNAKMDRFRKAVERLHQELPELTEQYPDQWVAMGEDGLLATAFTHEELLADLRARGIGKDGWCTKFLDTSKASMVL